MFKKMLPVLISISLILGVLTTSGYTKSGLDLIPYNAKTVFALTMNRTKLNQIKKNRKVARQISKAAKYGINTNNVKMVYAGSFDGKQKRRPNIIIIVSGRFNKNRIYKATKKNEGKKLSDAKYLGISYLKAYKSENYSIAVIGSSFFVLAKERHLKQVINLAKGRGRSVRRNRSITNYLRTVKDGNFFWLISKLTSSTKRKLFRGKKIASLRKINVISLSYGTRNGDFIKINGICGNKSQVPEVQKAMKEFVNQSIFLLSLLTKDKTFLNIVAKTKYSSNGNIATVKLPIGKKHFISLLKLIK